MSKFFINRPIVAMVISLLMVIIGIGDHRTAPHFAVPGHCAAGSADSRHLRGRRRADHRAIRSHADRAADERRRQPELHVLAECGGQRADDHDRELRREERSEYRPDAHADAPDAGRLAASAGRDQLRRDGAEIRDGAPHGDGTLFAEGHLRRQISGELLLHQPERPIDARSRHRQRAGIRSRPICDAPVDQAGSTGQAGHHRDRNRFGDSGAEHCESRGPGRRLAVSEGPGVHVLGAGPGTAHVARRVRRYHRPRTAERRNRSRTRCRAHRARRAGLHAVRTHQRQARRDYRRLSIARHQRGGRRQRRPQADGGSQETFPAGRRICGFSGHD